TARSSVELSAETASDLPIRDRELRFLLACLRLRLATPGPEPVPIPSAEIDWQRFTAWVERHGVTPLVHQALREAGETIVVPALQQRLRDAAAANARLVLLQVAEARGIVERLARAGIRSLAIKGPVLATLAFDDPTARVSRDIDLLIAPERVSEADRLIAGAGYRRVDPSFELTAPQLVRYRRVRCQFGYRSRQNELRIELHWRLTSNPRLLSFDDASLWSRPDLVQVAGIEFATLPREELFIYLCVHGSAHVWFRLKWLADIAALLRRMEGDELQRIGARSRALGVERPFLQALILAHRLLAASVPEPFLAVAESDRVVTRMVRAAMRAIAWHDSPEEPVSTRWFNTWVSWQAYRLKPGWRYRWAEFNDQIAAPEDWARIPLPEPLAFLYFPLRPLSWLARKLRGAIAPRE
ncbi:MAG TPA: nucleotidyltransferase family protein, partial [Stellaceae bacterium]|nr:nucleotidyltransferase family protein [Stellaceae bacterium]